ncbi:hypothetical protein [Pantoea agglomerans]|uniref:hypothetical protein n=1 Tax=Enterobacter agglomerans TaxID=549 RepID=UPI0016541554|nr:hypothetical protein [Pantoea agglomerans]
MKSEKSQKWLIKIRPWFLSLLTPTLISTFIATLFIWAHLARIGLPELFFDSVSFSSLFGYLMVFASVSVLLFCVVLFTPSLLTGLFIYSDSKSSEPSKDLTEKNIRNVFLTSILSALIFFGWFFISNFSSRILTPKVPIQLGLVWLCSILISVYHHASLTRTRTIQMGFLQKIGVFLFTHVLQPALFSLAASVWIFPVELFLRTLEFPDGTSEFRQALTIIAISMVLIIFSLIPGVVFLRLRGRTGLLYKFAITGGIMGGILFVICLFVQMVPAMILTMFLRTSGIMDLRPYIMAVPVNSYPSEYFREEDWKGARSEDGRFYLLQAVKLYSLGNIRLICPLSIIEPWRKSLKYQVLDKDYDDSTRGELQEAVTHCRRVTNNELLTLEHLPEKKPVIS